MIGAALIKTHSWTDFTVGSSNWWNNGEADGIRWWKSFSFPGPVRWSILLLNTRFSFMMLNSLSYRSFLQHDWVFTPSLPRWAAGHNVSLFFCRPLSHAFSVTGWQSQDSDGPRLAPDELRVTFCRDKWIEQCILNSSLAKIWRHDKLPGSFCPPAWVPFSKQHVKERRELKSVWGRLTKRPVFWTTMGDALFVDHQLS